MSFSIHLDNSAGSYPVLENILPVSLDSRYRLSVGAIFWAHFIRSHKSTFYHGPLKSDPFGLGEKSKIASCLNSCNRNLQKIVEPRVNESYETQTSALSLSFIFAYVAHALNQWAPDSTDISPKFSNTFRLYSLCPVLGVQVIESKIIQGKKANAFLSTVFNSSLVRGSVYSPQSCLDCIPQTENSNLVRNSHIFYNILRLIFFFIHWHNGIFQHQYSVHSSLCQNSKLVSL